MKKFLNESDKKKIISEKEKMIIESFANTFNKIKRIDENEINENNFDFDFPRKPVTNDDMGKWEERERMKYRIEARFNGLNIINSEDHNRRNEFGDGNLVIRTNGNLPPEIENKLSKLASENDWGFESFMDGLYLIHQGDFYNQKYQGSL